MIAFHRTEHQVNALGASERMLPIFERSHAVVDDPCPAAPHRNTAPFESHAAHRIGPALAVDTETIGAQASLSSRSWWRPSLAPGA